MDIITLALSEDIDSGDVSVSLLEDKNITAQVISRENAVLSGTKYFDKCFTDVDIEWNFKNGDKISQNDVLCTLTGNNKEIITKERTALNFLQTLSSTATQTNNLVKIVKNTNAQILDTRKTIPMLRKMQKQAVLDGGGVNHRFGLYDAVMLKENHISQIGITKAVKLAKQKYPNLDIIVEVENLEQLKEADSLDITRILCDNFDINLLKQAVKIAKKPLEASGNIDENNILKVAETGVDFISIGSITKNIAAIDFSLLIEQC